MLRAQKLKQRSPNLAVQISVVMPSYNHEAFIGEAIESVLAQSIGDFELIIVDDGSKDNSIEKIERYKVKDQRIRTIYHIMNCGIAKTLNDGISEAKGEFVAFIASDDLWTERKLEKQLEILRKNENLVVWSDGELIDEKDNTIGESFVKFNFPEDRRKSGNIIEELLLENFIFGSSLILKRESAANIRFNCQLKYLIDYLFVVELAEHFPYQFIREPLSKYRIHGKNTITRDQDNWSKDHILIRSIFLEKYSSEMSRRTKAYNLFMIARNLALLNRMEEARQFAAKAFITSNCVYVESLYYLAALISNKTLKFRFIPVPRTEPISNMHTLLLELVSTIMSVRALFRNA
jgi:glycosyltransferase involved in cell wall biosynthesis